MQKIPTAIGYFFMDFSDHDSLFMPAVRAFGFSAITLSSNGLAAVSAFARLKFSVWRLAD